MTSWVCSERSLMRSAWSPRWWRLNVKRRRPRTPLRPTGPLGPLQPGGGNNGCPARGFRGDGAPEIFWGSAQGSDVLLLERLPDLLRVQRLVGRAREPVDDRLRGSGGSHQPEPQRRLEPRNAGLGDGRQL